MNKRPTLRDIAAIAKVSHVTVSLALRKHPSLPKTTWERIEAIAKEIGYRPDPALSALMVYRRGAKPSRYQGTLAWINAFRRPEELAENSGFMQYFAGAEERCRELGYQLEEFRTADFGMRGDRLSKVLRARNIQGLLFAPQERDQAHFLLDDWENFSPIAFGFSLARPRLHVVTNAQFRSARMAVRKFRSLGYRRIGYVTTHQFEERTDKNFVGGFLGEQFRFPASQQLPVLAYQKSHQLSEAEFWKWYRRHKPDALLTSVWQISIWLQKIGPLGSPGCALASTQVDKEAGEVSGIYQNNLVIGRTAVDTVISMIHANERGIPAIPKRILIEGTWANGITAPRITPPVA